MSPRILVADDHASFRRWLAKALQEAGYTVLLAADGEEAVTLAATARPALVLTDVEMPKRSGLEVLRSIKQQTPTTPVLVLTGLPTAEVKEAARHLGAQAVLEKPADLDDLLRHIARLLMPQASPVMA